MKKFYVYIVECSDGSFYTGVTSSLQKRIDEHNAGLHPKAYTYSRRPVSLKWVQEFNDSFSAFLVEKQIKGWSRRKKLALIEQDWDKLVKYSRNYTEYGKDDSSTSAD
ncbi:GIY-YIG nuclease family protein [Salegentibacter sp. Hel_I_6]|uniref:GIY-YIG nuclease family protein n=1 Tax=Salegentibacter sp. Hel_I_6 TaxID=1250278 RepID=UPI00055E6763|nr:GIY-YIG nuclease family protein [Salegentibacter sp. Hel_I_6]